MFISSIRHFDIVWHRPAFGMVEPVWRKDWLWFRCLCWHFRSFWWWLWLEKLIRRRNSKLKMEVKRSMLLRIQTHLKRYMYYYVFWWLSASTYQNIDLNLNSITALCNPRMCWSSCLHPKLPGSHSQSLRRFLQIQLRRLGKTQSDSRRTKFLEHVRKTDGGKSVEDEEWHWAGDQGIGR